LTNNKPYLSKPNPTVGHHFSDLFSCPQRAWLHYYGNRRDQADDPAYLKALYHEGLVYERYIYENYFPNAYKVPQTKNKKKRQELTIDAMTRGESYILQGYLFDDKRIGVLDILECAGKNSSSRTGHIYRVGEIKRSAKLYTAHVLQAAWYAEMLGDIQGEIPNEVDFFLKGGGVQKIHLQDYEQEYDAAKKDLKKIRESRVCPGPFLIKDCTSCHWRSLCMPELVEVEHLSLVPWITREKAQALSHMGITTWKQLTKTDDSILFQVGLSDFEIEQIRHSLGCLEQETPPLRYPLKKNLFQNSKIVVMEFTNIAQQRKAGLKPKPEALYFEDVSGLVETVEIHYEDGNYKADISNILDGKKLMFYGSTDVNAFKQVCKHNGQKTKQTIDVFELVDRYVHSPVPGIELNVLTGHIRETNPENLIGKNRVKAIRTVVDWIEGSL